MRYRSYHRLQRYVHRGYQWQREVLRRALAEHRAIRDDAAPRVVELASGGGNLADVFSGPEYVGIDLIPERVAAAAVAHPGHRFVVGDVSGSDVEHLLAGRDFVFCHGLLHHLDDLQCRQLVETVEAHVSRPATVVVMEPWLPAAWPNLPGHLLCKLDDGKFIRPRHAYAGLFAKGLVREEATSNFPRWPVDMEAYVGRLV